MRSTTYDPAGTVSDGIAAYEQAVAGGRGAASVRRYQRLAGQIRSAMQPGDTCVLAFGAVLDRPEGRRGVAAAFVAVLDDRVLIAWRRGRLRPRSDTVVVPRESIRAARPELATTSAATGELIVLSSPGTHDLVLGAAAGTQPLLAGVLTRTAAPSPSSTQRE